MAEKDILEKILMTYTDIFADCVNVFAYGGKRRLKAEDLQPAPTESFYRGNAGMHNQFCDVSFYYVKAGEIHVQYIIENETKLKKRQVLRKASYEGGAYRRQLAWKQPVFPVISIVVEWSQKESGIPASLHRLLRQSGTQQEELQLVDDMRLNVHHIRKLPKQIRRQFCSDMCFVADYLNEGSFESRRMQKIVHAEALCKMMEAVTGDERFTDLAGELKKKQEEREAVIMCEYIDMLEARGEARGENRMAELIQILLKEQKQKELDWVLRDSTKRNEFYQAYGI